MDTQEAPPVVETDTMEEAMHDQSAMEIMLSIFRESMRDQKKVMSDGFARLEAAIQTQAQAQARQQRFQAWLIAILVLGFMVKAGVDISVLSGLLQPF